MKVHWFSILSVAGMILLTGSVLGSELRWKAPATGAIAPSVMHIPTVISTDELAEPSTILQVQGGRITPPLAPPLGFDVYETDPLVQNPPPGAVIQSPLPGTVIPPLPPQGESNRTFVPCNAKDMLKSIKDISYDIRQTDAARLPEECSLDSDPYYGRHFSQTCFMWKASALSTQAAYFEDAQLERHGHTKVCPALQPVVSGAKFFATVPFLPYKMGVTPPNECVYTLGHYRMGSCAPYMREPIPISPRGALFQAGAILGGIYAIP